MSPGAAQRTPSVLFISHSREVGGAELYLLKLVHHTASSGRWNVRLVCRRDAAVDRLAEEAAEVAAVTRLDLVRPADVLALRRLVRASDVVHLNLAFPSGKYQLAAVAVTALARTPLVVTHHIVLPVSGRWRAFERRLGQVGVAHIIGSEMQRAGLVDWFGYPPDRLIKIPNGVDTSVFRAPASPPENPHDPWLITVARLSPQKGYEVLLEAMSEVSRQTPAARLRIVGDGELRDEIVQRVRSLGLEEKVLMDGAMSQRDVADRLAAADVFVLASRYEGSPHALVEAMACGLACVATDVSGVRDFISDPALGRVVPVGDAPALAAAIQELLADPPLRDRVGARAREAVLDRFTIQRSMTDTEAVLERASRTRA